MDSVLPIPCKSAYHLNNQERREIFEILLQRSQNGKLKKGCITDVAAMFSVSTRTIRGIWKRAGACITNGLAIDVSSQLPGNVGRKRVQIDFSSVGRIALRRRTNIRSLSKEMKVSRATLHRRIKEGAIRPHTNALKPHLSEGNKEQRLEYCLSMLEPQTVSHQPIFKSMYNYVHIDEKWFFLSQKSERYYLLPEEHEPLRTCKSKHYITKVMFLAAVARPRFDPTRNQEFSGKIGIFPFTTQEPAKRNSKNRVAGTLETKPITVTKEISRAFLIEKVLPAIRAKWPRSSATETIFIQQDNARPHIHGNDVGFLQAANQDGFDIRLANQPPNSPDLNVLDLGYFRAIQSLQYQEAPATIDALISAVKKSFEELPSESLNNVFLTMQSCMIEIMKVGGGNNYKVPHMGKQKLISSGNLPTQLECDHELVENTEVLLQQMQSCQRRNN